MLLFLKGTGLHSVQYELLTGLTLEYFIIRLLCGFIIIVLGEIMSKEMFTSKQLHIFKIYEFHLWICAYDLKGPQSAILLCHSNMSFACKPTHDTVPWVLHVTNMLLYSRRLRKNVTSHVLVTFDFSYPDCIVYVQILPHSVAPACYRYCLNTSAVVNLQLGYGPFIICF